MEREDVVRYMEKQKADKAFWDYKKRIKALKKLYDNVLLMKEEIFAALKADLTRSEEVWCFAKYPIC